MKLWILEGRTPVPCYDPQEWAREFNRPTRIIKQEDIDDVMISTVFLGLDHNYCGKGPPLLFETMIFIGKESGNLQLRCSTYMQAEEMHESAVGMIQNAQAHALDITEEVFTRLKALMPPIV